MPAAVASIAAIASVPNCNLDPLPSSVTTSLDHAELVDAEISECTRSLIGEVSAGAETGT
jgi:hypothetical protein